MEDGGGAFPLRHATLPEPFLSAKAAMILVGALTAAFAAADFTVPGEVDMAVLYALSVVACAWTQSPRFLWGATALCVALTFAGQEFGPPPISGTLMIHLFWINRGFIAITLVVLAAFVHIWMERSQLLRAASGLLRQKNEALSESLRQSQKMEAVGQLTGGISHDFNNILTTVIGNLELLIGGHGDEAKRLRLARSALRSAENAAELVQHLLAFSRRQNLAPQVVPLGETLQGMLPLWRRALGESIETSLEISSDLWLCRVDPAQLEAAILNLVINARDAMPNGGRLTIRANNATLAEGAIAGLAAGDHIVVAVSDTGSGIPADILPHVFNPFFTTKEVGKGSGLGLPMVHAFAKQCGGTARLESIEGRGATVLLYLPRAPLEEPERAAGEDRMPDARAPPGATILIVEDEEHVRRMATDALEDAGYRVVQAGTGLEALKVLKQTADIDLVVSDIVMPGGMSGIELAQRIRQSATAPPVLLTTGYASVRDGAPVEEAGFPLLRKPFRPTDLCARIHSMMTRNGPTAAP